MKWDFFYDENESTKYQSFSDWERETHHIHWTLAILLILVIVGFLLLSTFSILE